MTRCGKCWVCKAEKDFPGVTLKTALFLTVQNTHEKADVIPCGMTPRAYRRQAEVLDAAELRTYDEWHKVGA